MTWNKIKKTALMTITFMIVAASLIAYCVVIGYLIYDEKLSVLYRISVSIAATFIFVFCLLLWIYWHEK